MMRKVLSIILLLFISIHCFSQDGYESWDKRYVKVNISDVIRFETEYADSVNRGLIEGKYYSRFSLFRIKAEFTGEKRDIADSIKSSMKNVNKLFGENEFLPVITAVKKEYRFMIDGTEYWFPIQHVLEEPFQNEIMKHDNVILYCVFFNEHRWNKALYNTFLISEFRKD
jgi:hypothetical protein